jgi:hypothetical protein
MPAIATKNFFLKVRRLLERHASWRDALSIRFQFSLQDSIDHEWVKHQAVLTWI